MGRDGVCVGLAVAVEAGDREAPRRGIDRRRANVESRGMDRPSLRSNRLSAWAEMARRVAHEVKNPLTPIQLAIEHVVRVYEDRSPDFEIPSRQVYYANSNYAP